LRPRRGRRTLGSASPQPRRPPPTPAPQLRRTLRQVVELQRDVQSLKASKGGGAGGDAATGQVASENEFLMQASRQSGFRGRVAGGAPALSASLPPLCPGFEVARGPRAPRRAPLNPPAPRHDLPHPHSPSPSPPSPGQQELVATKVELAQLKEQQLVVQRQLRQASVGRTGSGAGLSAGGRSTPGNASGGGLAAME
jgi:hypothetical protein